MPILGRSPRNGEDRGTQQVHLNPLLAWRGTTFSSCPSLTKEETQVPDSVRDAGGEGGDWVPISTEVWEHPWLSDVVVPALGQPIAGTENTHQGTDRANTPPTP